MSSSVRPLFIRSLSRDALFNLSLEHALLRKDPGAEHIGLVYRNDACIVIGRNQNPWFELDVSAMQSLGLPMIRRRSGGGAVYHDRGNSNYSFQVSKTSFRRRTHAELVARALNCMPIGLQYAAQSDPGDSSRGAYINERNDICVAIRGSEEEWKEKKVSGSAYKLTSSRAYHHGTMLLSSNLSELGTALKQSRSTMISKGVPSVPSPVVNLREAFPSRDIFLTHERFAGAVQSEFEALYGTARIMMIDHTDASLKQLPAPIMEEIEKSCAEMRSWEWTWGQTPSFTHRIKQGHRLYLGDDLKPIEPFEVEIAVENGIIVSSKLHIRGTGREDHDLSHFIQQLVSQRYDDLALRPDTIGAIGERFVQEQRRDCKPSTNERMLVLRAKIEQWLRLVL